MGTKGELYFPINSEIIDNRQNTKYVLKKLIGRGAYAQCYLAIAGGDPFALKIVKLSDLKSEKVRQKLETEIAIHSKLDHPNVVKMYTSFRTDEYIFMALELCERGALDDLLRRNGKLKERYAARFMIQIVKGMSYLHNDVSVVHRDLKLGNLFLDSSLNIKIGDFGLCAMITGNEKRRTVCGTPNYIAPEVLFGKATGHSFEADIWSLGVILYTLLIGTPPFQQKKVEEIYKLIERNQYIFPPENNLSNEAIDLITRLLTTNPNERPDLEQIAGHRFFAQKENLVYRVYKNLTNASYRIGPLSVEHVIFSIPINSISGIGYMLKSGICGVYYQDQTNAYIKSNSLVHVRLKMDAGKKIFVTEEHLLDTMPKSVMLLHSNIFYFINNYLPLHGMSFNISGGFRKENSVNGSRGLVVAKDLEAQNVFVAKVKKIKGGLLFVLTNNVFVFDFNDSRRVAVAEEGMKVYAFDDDGPIELTADLLGDCIAVLKMYCGAR